MRITLPAEEIEIGHSVIGVIADGEELLFFHGWGKPVKRIEEPVIGIDDDDEEIIGSGLVFRFQDAPSHRVIPGERVIVASLSTF